MNLDTQELGQLDQAVEQLGRMYRALASLHHDVYPKSLSRFGLLAEGPLEEIRRLQVQIESLTGAAVAREEQCDIWLRIHGATISWPDAPTSVLTAFLDAFRKGIQAVAEFFGTGALTTRPTAELKRACDLRVVAFQQGSLSVGVRLPDETDLDEPMLAARVREALRVYLQVAEWVGSEDPPARLEDVVPEIQQRRLLLNSVKPFLPRPRGDVKSVEVSGRAVPGRRTIQLGKKSTQRIDQAIDRLVQEQQKTYRGDLREIDLDNRSFVLRNVGDVQEIRCSFEEDLLEAAKEALDRPVEVTGFQRIEEGRRTSTPLRVTRLEITEGRVDVGEAAYEGDDSG